MTVGANFQFDDRVRMGGVEAVFGTALGTFGTNFAVSSTSGFGTGYAAQATFQRLIQHRNGQADSFNLFFEHRSETFAPVSFFIPSNPYDFEVGGGYSHSFSSEFYAGVDARYSKGRGRQRRSAQLPADRRLADLAEGLADRRRPV